MEQQTDFLSLGTHLHQVAGILNHRSFHRLLRTLNSRFDNKRSAIVHAKITSSLLNRLQTAIPDDYTTDLQRKRAEDMTAQDWRLLTDVIASRFQNLADKLTDYKLTAKQTSFSVPRSKAFFDAALSVFEYDKQRDQVKTLSYLNSPDGWIYRPVSVSYVSDTLYEVRSFLVAMSLLERETPYTTFESVLAWSFQQPELFWQKSYPYDLLVHDYDAVQRAENHSGFIRVCKSHLSTYFSESPIDSGLWQLGDFVEFRV